MAYTSSEVKNRWNAQHYKAVAYSVPKELGEQFVKKCEEYDVSKRSVIIDIIEKYLEVHDG